MTEEDENYYVTTHYENSTSVHPNCMACGKTMKLVYRDRTSSTYECENMDDLLHLRRALYERDRKRREKHKERRNG